MIPILWYMFNFVLFKNASKFENLKKVILIARTIPILLCKFLLILF